MAIPSFSGVPVLVTGGAGFIGAHLAEALAARGARVRVFDNFATGLRGNLEGLEGRIELLEGDLRDAEACRRACAGAVYVFHQAALGSVPRSLEDPATSLDVNVGGTANILAGAREAGARRVVYASSSSVYGDSPLLPKKEGEEGAVLSPYAMSKKMDEQLAEIFGRCYNLELVGLRYFNVYGPRQRPDGPYAAVIPRFFDASFRGEAPLIHGDGGQSRDFTFVEDAVTANLLAAGAGREACGRAFNVAGGRRASVLELAELIRGIAGGPPPRFGPPRPGDVLHSLADLSASESLLGYRPAVGLEEGLRRTAQAFRPAAAAAGR
jgi:nucleoside-diphosphate-sugar epimerase